MLLFRQKRFLGFSAASWVFLLTFFALIIGFSPYIYAIGWYGVRFEWFRGSSFIGFTFGIVGGLAICFEMLYWVRRKWRGWPSNHLVRIHPLGWPKGNAKSTIERSQTRIRSLVAIPQLIISIPLAFRYLFAGFLSAGTTSDRLLQQSRRWKQLVLLGLWPIISFVLVVVQIIFLWPFWIFSFLTVKSRILPVFLEKNRYKSLADVKSQSPDKQRTFQSQFEEAVFQERLKGFRLIWPTRIWLQGHIFWGMISLIAIIIHSGYRTGGPLTSLLSLLFAGVIFSGIWGLWMQQFRPRWLKTELKDETIYTQIDFFMSKRFETAESIFQNIMGISWVHANWEEKTNEIVSKHQSTQPSIIISALSDYRSRREFHGFFKEQLHPYLLAGKKSKSMLKSEPKCASIFRQIKSLFPDVIHPQIQELQELCDLRRALDRQKNYHWWLHSWLYLHLPLSISMFIVMLLHIAVALRWIGT